MPIATRTFRVFVSSTFEDLKEERNALQRDVFPKLRKLCEQHGARFQAIDLRWGVRDEAALDQQTMEICLREIERCQRTGIKPNFIVLLGDRNGWQPLPARIEAREFESFLAAVSEEDRRSLVWQEGQPAADMGWYRLDENAVLPEYVLRPREVEVSAEASEEEQQAAREQEAKAWAKTENRLRRILLAAIAQLGWAADDPRRIKYEASATHQEILAGLGETEADGQHVFGFFRRTSGETDSRLEDLKAYLRRRLPGNIVEFDAGETAKLCDEVLTHMRQLIESEVKRFEDRPALELEVEAHDRFAEERSRIFIGRQVALETIAEYTRGPERRPLVLYGGSGSGKSAVMAKASQQYKGPGRVIRRFIGASPESASGHALLSSLCRQIAAGEVPVDYAQLEKTFKERLSTATADQPLVLFIDALDQLTAGDPTREATWLLPELPPHVKVIVSTTADAERLPAGLPVQIEPMTQLEGREALDAWLSEAGRKLQPRQREKVLAHFARFGLPLYLKLAAEESKLWKSYASQDECTLGEGVAGVIDTLLDRLASNANHGPILVDRSLGYLAAARYGLTEDEMLDVLTADDAVWSDFDQRKHHEVGGRRLPVVVWSRLSLDLEPYLTERAVPGGEVMTFYHRQLAEHVTQRFLAGVESHARHASLAGYFAAKPAWLDQGRRVPDARRAVELVFQQRSAEQWSEAEEALFDSQFLIAKVGAGMALDLDSDYQALLQEAPGTSLSRREALRLMGGALRLSMHVVAKDSPQFASQMVGRLLAHRGKADVPEFLEGLSVAAPRPWLRPLHAALDPPGTALLRTLPGITGGLMRVAMSGDGRRAVSAWDASDGYPLKVWDLETGRELRTLVGHSSYVRGAAVSGDGRCAVSASYDKTLKVWDLETGRELHTLRGHSHYVDGVAMTPDGKRAVSVSSDDTLKVWDLETGRELRTLSGHWFVDVAVSADGRRAVSASGDCKMNVWDLESGRQLRTLSGTCLVWVSGDGRHAVFGSGLWDLETGRELWAGVGFSGVSGDGRRAVSISRYPDQTLIVWDLETGRELRTLSGHMDLVQHLAVSADGRRAVTASLDKKMRVWDLETCGEARIPPPHSRQVNGVALSGDGRRAVSASSDQTLKVWDLETGRELWTLSGHSHVVHGAAVSGDGRRAVSASYDETLKVWDLETGRELWTLYGHSHVINGVAVSGDGRRAVSASQDQTLKVWDLETGRELGTLFGHSDGILGVGMSGDGGRAVSACEDETLKVWNLETGRELATLAGHSGPVYGVALSGNGRRAVSASQDQTLKVWDLETGQEVRTLYGHSSLVKGVAVSGDGRRAVSASQDQTLKVWDLETGAIMATFTCDAEAYCCAFTGAQKIVAGDEDGQVYFLALEE